LVDVYVLAESLVDTLAKNRFIDAVHSFIVRHSPRTILKVEGNRAYGQYFSAAALVSLHNGTPVMSPAGRVVVDQFADNVSPERVVTQASLFPQEFFISLTVMLLIKRPSAVFDNMISQDSSKYHVKLQIDARNRRREHKTIVRHQH
jgi:hypothetical protein